MDQADQFRARIEEATTRRDRLQAQLAELDERIAAGGATPGLQERRRNLQAGIEGNEHDRHEAVARLAGHERLVAAAANPGAREAGTNFHAEPIGRTSGPHVGAPRMPHPLETAEPRDSALATLDRCRDTLTPTAGDRLTRMVEGEAASGEPFAITARYIAAVGQEAYAQAFRKLLQDPTTGHLRFTPAEAEAFAYVQRVEQARAMAVGAGATGGFAVPLTLDPTLLAISDGALNPIRQAARVITITGQLWEGVTTTAVVAAFAAEATEASDNSPTLAQPVARPERAQAFVPYSIEVDQDWGALQSEMGRLFADAKDVLESQKYLTGAGSASHEPQGILTGLGTASVVTSAGTAAVAVGDVYSVKEALPPRFMPRAQWLMSPTFGDRVFRLVASASASEPQIMGAGRGGPQLGRPLTEWSSMTGAVSSGGTVAIYGDIAAAYTIVDRIGMSVEVVPHLFGSANRFPTGQRGLYAFWRTSAVRTVDNAIRVLAMR